MLGFLGASRAGGEVLLGVRGHGIVVCKGSLNSKILKLEQNQLNYGEPVEEAKESMEVVR